ncbi:CobW family GTP-binding protein [Paractinoplanes brasiliensis]|uniref:G3E family GTPase n=1 Tax=Paractinoplanes brasiliensis TaxID=52695 RepID=A0A4R6K0Z9_9ACTN|nr:GTP-binding protein [Actinoplanes brasiliensis]TDO41932.1 G3E family GTPase [Actinoplanes brasiliensis]GID29786.1 cobalamin biosynthesis protein CobW [Actinoplanes brasiliensis]
MTDSRPHVTVLAGFSAAATDAVARSLLVTDPSLVLVTHDLTGVRDGVVRRTVRTADEVLEQGRTDLVHGCVSCTLREDILPTLVRLSRERPGSDLVLALPPAVEPEAVAAAGLAVAEAVRFDSYVTVVEATAVIDDLTSTDSLRDRDLHAAGNDERGVADVVIRQIEFADTLVVWSTPGADALERDRLAALLHRLAPWAAHVHVGDSPKVDCTGLAGRLLRSGRHDPAVPGMMGRALEGYPIGIHDRPGEHGVNAMLFQSRRPFHPQRLHDALDDLTAEALRGRGQLWIATQPGTAIAWESSGGGLLLGNLGHWLAALPRERWDEATDMRRLAADATWDLYYGDRNTMLSFVGFDLDVDAMTATLSACLLSDAELADGTDSWRVLPDPFADFLPADGDADQPTVTERATS